MNEKELYEFLLNTLQPSYEKRFNTERRKNVMNVSSLVSGAASYLYHWKTRSISSEHIKLNLALLRGSAFHAYINQSLKDFDSHTLKWNLPYDWKSGEKDITLLGHFDNLLPVEDGILVEWKSTGQEDIIKNGLLLRAKRQIGTYAKMLKFKTGIDYEAFVVIFNSDVHIIKLTPDESNEGFSYVRKTALEVARKLDQ